jgi:hypothetical protein
MSAAIGREPGKLPRREVGFIAIEYYEPAGIDAMVRPAWV